MKKNNRVEDALASLSDVGQISRGAIALDKSARTSDINGYVSIEGNPIIKAGVFPYLGRDIPGAPDPDKVYQVYRSEEELKKPETIESFKMMPFINDHTWLGEDGTDPGQLPLTGMTGEQVYFDSPYLRANLCWYSQELKQAMAAGKVELSPAYRFDVVPAAGVYNGQPYQYQQTNIRGNHLALVDEGRNGRDVRVMDGGIMKKKNTPKTADLIKALAALYATKAKSPMAQDSAAKNNAVAKAIDEL